MMTDSSSRTHGEGVLPSVALSVIGKFHIWALANELYRLNAPVRLYTGYPRWKLHGGVLPARHIRSHAMITAPTLGLGRITSHLKPSDLLSKFHGRLTETAKHDFERFVARDMPHCDVFHGMSQYSLQPGLAARSRYGALFVLDVGSSHILSLKKLLEDECQRLGVSRAFFSDETIEHELEEYQQADVITVPSQFAAKTFVENGISPDRIEVNVLGVELADFFPDEIEAPKTFRVAFAGALSVRKGLHVLLEAFRIAGLPEAELVLIGPAQPETQTLLQRYGGSNVRVVGRVPHSGLRKEFSRSSVFVLPSIEDGFGMVILEALASGCPVIASDHTGGPDVIVEGENGYVIPSGSAEALAEIFVRLYKDRELLNHLRRQAARHAQRSSGWNIYSAKVIDMYRRRLARDAGARNEERHKVPVSPMAPYRINSDIHVSGSNLGEVNTPDVVVVNGYKRFYSALPEELHRVSRLFCLVTGAYPYVRLERPSAFLQRFTILATRFIWRRLRVSESLIESCWVGESLNYVAIDCAYRGWRRSYEFLNGLAIDIMSRRTSRVLRRSSNRQKIFWVRSGFGGHAINVARQLGYVTICDHSIAHPRTIEGLIRENGNLESGTIVGDPRADIWKRAANDILLCDHVVVCSDFVKSTFVKAGARMDNVHVVYWGIDEKLRKFVSNAKANGLRPRRDGPLTLLFAGGDMRRKGIAILAAAMDKIRDLDCRLKIVGALTAEHRPHIGRLDSDPRVTFLGVKPHDRLAELMCTSEIFIFPSFAEGSAQVIFEAMAAGCFIITTPNSGSIVRDGIDGFVVPPGDADALADAVRRAAANRSNLAEIGARNAQLVSSEYTQDRFGKQVVQLLDSLMLSREPKSGSLSALAESQEA